MSEEQRWKDADALVGATVVCATISKLGMRAFHTSAAAMTPIGDFTAVGGKTHKLGLTTPEPDGLITIRPGYEQLVRDQLADYRERRAVRPTTLQLQTTEQRTSSGNPDVVFNDELPDAPVDDRIPTK